MSSSFHKRFILSIFLVILAPALLLCADGAYAQKKAKKQPREKKPAAQAAETPDTPDIKKSGDVKSLEQSITASAKIDIAGFIKDAMAAVSNKNPGQTVKLNITAQLASESSEIMVFTYSERYNKPVSLKAEIAAKYPAKDYFTFESDYGGMKGVQIVSKASAASHIDMIGYQVSTDSVIIGYAMTDPKAADAENLESVKPKISSEGAFYRQAANSAFLWKNQGDFNFYDTSLLKKFRSSEAFGRPASITSIGVEGKTGNISIFAYKDFKTASGFFPALKLSQETPRDISKNQKTDAAYKYFLNDRFIIAISSR